MTVASSRMMRARCYVQDVELISWEHWHSFGKPKVTYKMLS